MKQDIRILIVDDHFLMRIGLLTSLKTDPQFIVVGEAGTAAQAIEAYRRLLPEIVLMDLRLPDSSGIEATLQLLKEFPAAKIIMISSYEVEEDIYRSFQAGARGYLLKSIMTEELFRAIKQVNSGARYTPPDVARSLSERNPDSDLTLRELEVLELLIKGFRNKEIAEILGCSENTAKYHIKNIFTKLEVNDRTEAATVAFQRGILH